jgi:hypothetical protein
MFKVYYACDDSSRKRLLKSRSQSSPNYILGDWTSRLYFFNSDLLCTVPPRTGHHPFPNDREVIIVLRGRFSTSDSIESSSSQDRARKLGIFVRLEKDLAKRGRMMGWAKKNRGQGAIMHTGTGISTHLIGDPSIEGTNLKNRGYRIFLALY